MDEIAIMALGVNLKVADLARSRVFYEALGFQELGAFAGGVVYGIGGVALLELNDRHPAVAPAVFQERITTAKTSLMVKVPSLLPILAAAERKRIPLAVPPRRFPWQTIEVVVRDPDGLIVVFIAPDSEAEFQAVQEHMTAMPPALPDADDETAHLLRSPRNRERLFTAVAQAERGDGTPMTLAEVRKSLGLVEEA